ncbi:MAG: elongation factor Tu [Thermoplasmata archaeon]|nr:elongation factor Tu [Thermoplasmata archaeon]
MANLNIAVIGNYGKKIGKEGTKSDITFYNVKRGDTTLTLIEASRYPEKLSSLFYALSIADYVIFHVENIDRYFGESLIAVEEMGIKKGWIIRNDREEEIKEIISSVETEYEFLDDSPADIREMLIEMAEKIEVREERRGSVSVDHFFNVRGIGTVILGTVIYGSVRKHEDMEILPSGKKVHIRSIQKHDDDYEIANKGDRVGIALKNIDVDDIERGDIITSEEWIVSDSIEISINRNKYYKDALKDGMVVHVGNHMQFIPARLSMNEKTMLKMEKPLVFKCDEKLLLTYLDSRKMRIIGTASPCKSSYS